MLAARGCHAARVGIGPPSLEGRRASDRPLSLGARPWCHALALASRAAGLHVRARERPPRSLSVGRRRGRRARYAAQVRISPPALEGRRASDRPLSFGARPWCHALALASRAAGLHVRARERPPRSLSVGRRRGRRARYAAQVRISPPALEGRRASDRPLSFGARPWCHAPALASLAAGLRICSRERPPRALSVGRRHSTCSCRSRVPRRAG